MMIIDAHLDLAMNAVEWNRDLTRTAAEIRLREAGMTDKPDRGKGMVSLKELRKGNVGLVVATQLARYVSKENTLPGWHSPEQAWAQTQGQLAWYKAMEERGQMKHITELAALEKHIHEWNDRTETNDEAAIGYILSLEGADSLVNISYLEKAYRYGLRAIGPAHYGPGRYAPGTGERGPLTPMGKELLKEMDALNMILDVTHLTDESFGQALSLYKGPVWASHHNCRKLVSGQRQLSDEQIRLLIERGAVIGGVLDAWMLKDGWIKGISDPGQQNIRLEMLIDHYDHICQLAGNCLHVAIGSDLDGMYGKEQSPADMDSIKDLKLLEIKLEDRGFRRLDIERILYRNWLDFLRKAWR